MGEIGKHFSSEAQTSAWKGTSVPVDEFKYDIKCFVDAVRSCTDGEDPYLTHLMKMLAYNEKMEELNDNHPELALVYNTKGKTEGTAEYNNDDTDLFRFWRNYFVHATKGPQVKMEHHYDHLYRRLNALCPGFECMVYEVLYSAHRFEVFL
ncbi:hypothetical protein PIB30_080202 [Stylosanthes scabra]|uniref:Uncharacterized protein n=1 Tax=Stylosanthes scabra TaxID=79078 RepID=A0ABU6SSW6_9FABA|nr:hypothetical protein [Stylosanthes scabra]